MPWQSLFTQAHWGFSPTAPWLSLGMYIPRCELGYSTPLQPPFKFHPGSCRWRGVLARAQQMCTQSQPRVSPFQPLAKILPEFLRHNTLASGLFHSRSRSRCVRFLLPAVLRCLLRLRASFAAPVNRTLSRTTGRGSSLSMQRLCTALCAAVLPPSGSGSSSPS